MRIWIVCCVAALLLLSGSGFITETRAAALAEDFQTRLDAQIELWVQGLSGQRGFEEWSNAEREISALGPGTHGWLVTFGKDRRTVGYMVIHASDGGGFKLTEYGLGE